MPDSPRRDRPRRRSESRVCRPAAGGRAPDRPVTIEDSEHQTVRGLADQLASITELAAAERIDRSYLCRVIRLTLLAPDIVEAVIDGRQAEAMALPGLMKGLPEEWDKQR